MVNISLLKETDALFSFPSRKSQKYEKNFEMISLGQLLALWQIANSNPILNTHLTENTNDYLCVKVVDLQFFLYSLETIELLPAMWT